MVTLNSRHIKDRKQIGRQALRDFKTEHVHYSLLLHQAPSAAVSRRLTCGGSPPATGRRPPYTVYVNTMNTNMANLAV